MFELNIVLGAPPERVGPGLEFDPPGVWRIRIDDKSRHTSTARSVPILVAAGEYKSMASL